MSADTPSVEERVEAALRRTRDPDRDVDVFEAGIVEGFRVDDGRVTVEADLGAFDPRTETEFVDTILHAVRSVEGVTGAHVEPTTPDEPSAEGRVGTASIDRIVAVASTKGGVGKSTVAANLACALARTQDVALFDADIFGPNATNILDASGPVVADDEDRPIPVESHGIEVMSVGLLTDGGPLAWRGAMAHDALSDLFGDVAWNDPDTLVIDMPPGTSDVILTTLQEVPIDGVVLVTTPFQTSVEDTQRSLRLFHENDVPVLGVVQNMVDHTCPNCGDIHELFPNSTGLDALDVPVLAALPFDPAIQDSPTPTDHDAAFDDLADRVTARLDEIWNPDVPGHAVDIRGLPTVDRREAVAEAFTALDPGDEFVLVSDRDPSPVSEYLADLADVDPDAFETFRVRKQNPDTWLLQTVHP